MERKAGFLDSDISQYNNNPPYWSTLYKGDFSEFNEIDIPYIKDNLVLRDHLLQFGGSQVHLPHIEFDFSRILTRGRLWKENDLELFNYNIEDPSTSIVQLWRNKLGDNEKSFSIIKGYALCAKDNLWRKSLWGVERNKGSLTYIDIEGIEKTGYFGYVLSSEEATFFALREDN